ncbi:MAG: hypothetical protein K2M48_05185, partial [Clostridiales bacterium]|nr:hypothetical protein [Clostridiales bacterium]
VEEILSLRDDVKAARIVDQNDVSSELEAIKNELAAIASGSVLDEIRALRDDIAAITGGQVGEESDSAPTDGELNLVLNEIVSLRDEVFALKDEVLNATGIAPTDEAQLEEAEAAGGDVVNSILDELGDLRDAQGVLTDSIEELKEVISRGTTTVATDVYGADGAETVAAQPGELNVVLDEINNLKSYIDGANGSISNESIDTLSKQIQELRDRIDAFVVSPSVEEHIEGNELDDIRERLDNIALNASAVDIAALADRIDEIGAVINDLRIERENVEFNEAVESGVVSGSLAESFESLRADIEDVKAAIATMAAPAVGDEIAELRAEIENLRAENEALRTSQNDALALELFELKNAIHDMALSATPTAESGDTSYAALIDEIKSLKEAVSAQPQTTATPFADELGEIRDEIAQLRSLTTVTVDQRGGQAEIAALRDELADLKSSIASPDSMFGLAEDVTTIRADVQTLKEEPDLGVMNEILALRDEFQALREQIEDVKRIAAETDKQSDDNILSEVQSLRDQLFAIS